MRPRSAPAAEAGLAARAAAADLLRAALARRGGLETGIERGRWVASRRATARSLAR